MARRLLLALVAVALLVPLGATAAPGAGAGSGQEDRVRQIEAELGELSGAEADALAELDAVRARRQSLDSQIANLDGEVLAAELRLGDFQSRIDTLTARYLWYDRKLSEARARLRHAREAFSLAAVELYLSGGSPGAESAYMVIDTGDPLSVSAGTAYLEHVGAERRDVVLRFDAAQARLDRLTRQAEAKRAEGERQRAEADSQRDRLVALRTSNDRLRSQAAAEEQSEASLLASIRSRASAYEAELATLRASSNAITDLLRGRQLNQPLAASFSVVFPTTGRISSPFGWRMHPILNTRRLHTGIDIGAAHGTPAWAAADGVVAYAGPRSGYGNTVIIDHGNQYATLYGHLSQITVRSGDVVEARGAIGAVGSTGMSTGPHLHFEVRRLGIPEDPMPHL